MSKRYTSQEREAALAQLQANGSNVIVTSVHLGIPARTLYHWQQLRQTEAKLQRHPPPPLPQSASTVPDFKDETEIFQFLRDQLKQRALEIVASFNGDLQFASPYQRALMLAQFLETMEKLESNTPANETELPSFYYPVAHWRDTPTTRNLSDEERELARQERQRLWQAAIGENQLPPQTPEETPPTIQQAPSQ